MTLLLGATFALLLVAVLTSLQGMKNGIKNVPQEEIQALRKQIDELKIEQQKLAINRQMFLTGSTQSVEKPSMVENRLLEKELAAKDNELARLAQEKADAEQKAATYSEEAGLIGQRELEKNDNELRRARLIRDALLIGRITEYVSDPEIGNFVTLDIVMPDQAQEGAILAIRRKTGILGKIKITEVSPEGAIASPMPGFGVIKPEPGDELIIPPHL